MAKTNLRFAALVRVSTEKQAKQGESLRTQTKQIADAVKRHGGTVAKWYKGQEHATPGHERVLLEELLADAQRNPKPFDAVIVADESRWSRDNAVSKRGLSVLRERDIRFFALGKEHDLHNANTRFWLAMSAEIGELNASVQNRKSIENRIERAKEEGAPTCGKRPFGREWDKEARKWRVIPEKKAMMEDVAKRYLAGEPMHKLAAEYGVNHTTLHKNLMHRCGTKWRQRFRSVAERIDETVETDVPRLLDETTIRACRGRAERNKTFRGKRKYKYLLGGLVYCAACGYTMTGQTNPNGHPYYRHTGRNGAKACACKPRPWVRAEELENAVLAQLFDTFGNPRALQHAIEEATPNLDKLTALQGQLERVTAELKKIAQGRDRVVALVAKGRLTDEQVDKELEKLASTEEKLKIQAAQLHEQLGNQPTPDTIKATAKRVAGTLRRYSSAKQVAARQDSQQIENMTWDDARALVMDVFAGNQADGQPCGVYVAAIEGQADHRRKRWAFTLRGKVVDGKECVTKPCLVSPTPTLPARRFAGRFLPPGA